MIDMLEKISNNLELSKKNYTKWGRENGVLDVLVSR